MGLIAVGCLGGPTLRPAVTNLLDVRTVSHTLEHRLPFLYFVTMREGNLESLNGLTLGNREVFPLLALDTTNLQAGEIAPLGVGEPAFLLTYGIQGQPKGTLQTVDLTSGKVRKAIGSGITEDSWTMRVFGAPHLFLAERPLDAEHLEVAFRFQRDGDVPILLDATTRPDHYFGAGPDNTVLYRHRSEAGAELWLLELTAAVPRKLATFEDDLIGVLVQHDITEGLRGFALTATRAVTGRMALWSWTETEAPTLLREFPLGNTRGLVPPGWPILIGEEAVAVAVTDTPDLPGGVYLHREGATVQTHTGGADYAWLVGTDHLFWIIGRQVWYRQVTEPEETAVQLYEFPVQRDWAIYAGGAASPGTVVP